MASATPAASAVLQKVRDLGSAGTPVTTPEVAEGFECSQRTIYNRLESLVDSGALRTKKVGANSRVWWRPVDARRARGVETGDDAPGHAYPVFDSQLIGVIIWGADMTIRDANEAFLEMAGLTHEEALRTSWRELTPEAFHADSEQHIDEVAATGSGEPYEKQYYHGDGDRWWGRFESRRLSEDRFVEFVVDVTERKRTMEALRESQGRLDAFVTATSDVVYRMSPDWSEMYYLDGREFIVDTDEPRQTWLDEYIPMDERDRVMAAIEEAIDTKTPFELEHQVLQVDGSRGWTHSRAVPMLDDAGEIVEWFGTASDVTERKEMEADLRRSEARYRTVLNSMDEGFFLVDVVFDRTGEPIDILYRDSNPAATAMVGEEFEGRWLTEIDPGYEEHWYETFGRVASTGEGERSVRYAEPDDAWYEFYVFKPEDAGPRRVALVFQDITERKLAEEQLRASEAALQRLNAATRELIDAGTGAIASRVAPLVRDVLDVEYAALWRYDDQQGELREHAVDVASRIDLEGTDPFTDAADRVWETFVGTTIDVQTDLDSRLPSRMLVPLGRHGVLCLGATAGDAFDARMVDLVETVATTVETAWDRATGEEELTRRNEELTRLDRLNSLIRGIDQALVAADSRAGIEEAVCERLANSEPYAYAWIAGFDAAAGALRPVAWAGVESGYLEDRIAGLNDEADDDPLVAAHRSRSVQVIGDIATDVSVGPWREAALDRGGRSAVSIPLTYEESIFGILTVASRSPRPDDRETAVLAELGQTIAYAMNAMESTMTGRPGSVVQLTIGMRGASSPLLRLAQAANARITVEGLVPSASGAVVTVFCRTTGATPDAVLAAGEETLAIESLALLEPFEDGGRFRIQLTDPQLVSTLLAGEAAVRTITIEPDSVTAVVELPRTELITPFLDDLRRSIPELELLARTTRHRQVGAEFTLRTTLEDRLTARQLEVLQVAYESGFFESPRTETGEQIASTLGISPSTFSYHLRESQRRLCQLAFEPA